jgi:3-oxoacyl-[acyl-carrier-protein] synthase-3
MLKDVLIRATGRYVPERVFTNHEFETFLDTNDDWITERTGIKQRHFAAPDEHTSDMAAHAARECMERAGLAPRDIDLVLVATVTPDTVFPATANWLQAKLGCTKAWSFDINAGCSGFIYGLSVATAQLRSGQGRYALLIGAEKMTALLDFTDRSTCVLFGDGAACVLLEGVDPAENSEGFGIREFCLCSDGTQADVLYQPAGGSNAPPNHRTIAAHDHYVHMSGREVYSHAIRRMEQNVHDVLEHAGVTADEIDWFIPHQANQRIIETIQQRLGVPRERFYVNIDRYGNTTAATIPLCLDELALSGELKPGQKVVLFTFGTGFTWGSCYLVWGGHV